MRASAIFYADFLLVSKFFLILLPLPLEPIQTLIYKGFEGGGRGIFLFHFAST
jgi:hypothetical protein